MALDGRDEARRAVVLGGGCTGRAGQMLREGSHGIQRDTTPGCIRWCSSANFAGGARGETRAGAGTVVSFQPQETTSNIRFYPSCR